MDFRTKYLLEFFVYKFDKILKQIKIMNEAEKF